MLARFVTALSLVLVSCSADNCAKVSSTYQLKSTLPEHCNGIDANTCTSGRRRSRCDCGNCCEPKPNVCATLRDTNNCGNDQQYDETKDATVASATNYANTCCMTATNTTTTTTPSMCESVWSAPCNAGQARSKAKEKELATAADFSSLCCDIKVKCNTYTCTVGKKLKASPETIDCDRVPCEENDEDTCCEYDTTLCLGLSQTNTCGSNYTEDVSKLGVAATVTTFVEKCCAPYATCEAFKASTSIGTETSTAAMKQSAATLLFLTIIGVSA